MFPKCSHAFCIPSSSELEFLFGIKKKKINHLRVMESYLIVVLICVFLVPNEGFPGGSVVKNPPANTKHLGSIPGLGRSPGGGNGNPLQYSCLGNGQRSLVGYSPWDHKRVGHNLATKQQMAVDVEMIFMC